MQENEHVKTPEQVRQSLRRTGTPIAQWAREKGFDLQLVYDVLSGRNKATYGKSHKIAVALGIKDGESQTVSQ